MRPHCVRIDAGNPSKLVFVAWNAPVVPLKAEQPDVDSDSLRRQVIRPSDEIIGEEIE
jgi:hypothetical protein